MFTSIFGKNGRNQAAPSQTLGTLVRFGGTPAGRLLAELMTISMVILGRENAGKTAMTIGMDLTAMGEFLPSGLQLNLLDPDGQDLSPPELATRMDLIQRRLWEMSQCGNGLHTTLKVEPVNYALCEGSTQRFQLITNDEIGQVINFTRRDSTPEEHRRSQQLIERMALAHVITLVLSPPAGERHALTGFQWARDLKMAGAYITASLQKRAPERPVSLAIVVNKIDTLSSTEQAARRSLSDEVLLKELQSIVQLVKNTPEIAHAAIFPVSVLGFGNAVEREPLPAEDDAEAGEPLSARAIEAAWCIDQGRAIEPFNLQSLLLWSLLAGALEQRIELPADCDQEPALARVCRLLSEDLATSGGWVIPVKGDLVSIS